MFSARTQHCHYSSACGAHDIYRIEISEGRGAAISRALVQTPATSMPGQLKNWRYFTEFKAFTRITERLNSTQTN